MTCQRHGLLDPRLCAPVVLSTWHLLQYLDLLTDRSRVGRALFAPSVFDKGPNGRWIDVHAL